MKKNKKKISIQAKILLPVTIIIMIISIIMGFASYCSIKNGIVSMGVEDAKMAGRAAKNVIDGDLIYDIIPGSENTSVYKALFDSMKEVRDAFGITYLYTLYESNGTVFYGVDVDELQERMNVGEEFELGYEELSGVFAGEEYAENRIDYTEDGALITMYLPIEDSSGNISGIIGCDYDASAAAAELKITVFHTVAAAFLCMAAALILISIVVRRIMNNLKIVDRKVYELVNSDGDLTHKLDIHTGDELEIIANNLNIVLGNICAQANIAKEVAKGNLTVEVFPKSEKDLLGNALKDMVEKNSNALKGISKAAAQAKISSSQMANASEALARSSTEQAEAVGKIKISVNDITEKTIQNLQYADKASEFISQTIKKVKKGNEQMNNVKSAMGDINKSSENISEIIKVIDDIAFQTNLLSLNASIEAARAGKFGKGFSVVAQEIRALAVKSADAVSKSASLIEHSVQSVKSGSSVIAGTAAVLEEITKSVRHCEEIIKKILEASDFQALSVTQINKSIEEIYQTIQTNSAASQECAATSDEVSNQMNSVYKMLSAYKLE